ncbi:probable E3 ubiquitin-protein ligase RNF217 [Brassica rapa]|uniref:probable E3 ubiquitin-protein ligase RNF217 n=1 Tax=Brassica campestris TaxID=3711 RepID=UPI00142DB3B2|nr:probable E3 ubiquitin-protein ligase RNF217 [Brassica rapa]
MVQKIKNTFRVFLRSRCIALIHTWLRVLISRQIRFRFVSSERCLNMNPTTEVSMDKELELARQKIDLVMARDAIASQTRWIEEGDDTNTENETCPACYTHVSRPHKLEVRSGCFHRICFTCIRDCVSSQLARGDTVLCPYPGCENELVLEDCRGVVDDDALNLIIHRKKEKAIPVLDRVYCPKPSCNFLMADRDLLAIDPRQKKSVERTCVECGLCFCKKYHVPWHYKKTCDEFKKSQAYLTSDAALFESLVKTQGWIKCPQCATVVQKNGGCQRISCRHCNHKFCYACGAACTRKKMSCNCSPQD